MYITLPSCVPRGGRVGEVSGRQHFESLTPLGTVGPDRPEPANPIEDKTFLTFNHILPSRTSFVKFLHVNCHGYGVNKNGHGVVTHTYIPTIFLSHTLDFSKSFPTRPFIFLNFQKSTAFTVSL